MWKQYSPWWSGLLLGPDVMNSCWTEAQAAMTQYKLMKKCVLHNEAPSLSSYSVFTPHITAHHCTSHWIPTKIENKISPLFSPEAVGNHIHNSRYNLNNIKSPVLKNGQSCSLLKILMHHRHQVSLIVMCSLSHAEENTDGGSHLQVYISPTAYTVWAQLAVWRTT